MKKIFTLIVMAVMALGANAETLINYPTAQDGITASGSTTFDAVKIKTNTTSVPGIKFSNSYTTDNALNDNYAKLEVEGGFKAGDVVTIAGAFNNSDGTKKSAVDLFVVGAEKAITVLFTTQQFVNGKLTDDDPVVETYTLEADAEALYLGRNGNTGTIVTTLKVVRGEESEPEPPTMDGLIDYPTVQDGITVSGSTAFDAVKIKTNTTSVPGIKFSNSYTTDNALNDNYAKLEVEGGFKAGDVVTIAGAFNNSDGTKKSAVDLFVVGAEKAITVLFTTQQFVNGKLTDDDPVVETYTLEADAEALYLGRNGNTGTIVTTLKVVRGGATAIKNVKVQTADGVVYNLAGQKVGNDFKGVVIKEGKKMLQK